MLGINNPFMYNDEKWPDKLEKVWPFYIIMMKELNQKIRHDLIFQSKRDLHTEKY